MRAIDLAEEYPSVTMNTTVLEAARLLAGENRPGIIVVDDRGRPISVLAPSEVIRMAVPGYVQEDPTLARVIDEDAADVFLSEMGNTTVGEVIKEGRNLPVVKQDAHLLEMAAMMARLRYPLVAVVDAEGLLAGAVTLDHLLDEVLAR